MLGITFPLFCFIETYVCLLLTSSTSVWLYNLQLRGLMAVVVYSRDCVVLRERGTGRRIFPVECLLSVIERRPVMNLAYSDLS